MQDLKLVVEQLAVHSTESGFFKDLGYVSIMSTLKVDTILKRTGTGTITVGQSGDTISVPTGAATLNSVSGSHIRFT